MCYEYNEDGLRTVRQLANGARREYFYNGTQLEYIKIVNANGNLTSTMRYIYNSSGQAEYIMYIPAAYAKNSNVFSLYYILRDSEGKIHKLIKVRQPNSAGTGVTAVLKVAVTYTYGPYGELLKTTKASGESVGTYNPLVYKDYIWDSETDWYYVQSRYYDPVVGRFINADAYVSTGQGVLGTNMFVYCGNNPIDRKDASGYRYVQGTDACGGDGVANSKITTMTKQLGVAVNSFAETSEKTTYMFFITHEVGSGYSKSFDTGKPMNLYGSQEWLGDYSAGFDMNYSGKGVNFEVGTDASVGIHWDKDSYDIGTNQFGRSYIQHSYLSDTGVYYFEKLSFNGPEIVGTVFAAIYAPYLLPAIGTLAGASA